MHSLYCALTLRIQRVINHELAIQDLVIGEPQRSESVRDPTQSFASRMRIGGVGVRGTHDFSEQAQGWIVQRVLVENGIKGNAFSMMS